jgi:hypothetical protein
MSELPSNKESKIKNIKLALVFGVLAVIWFFVSMAVIWNQ